MEDRLVVDVTDLQTVRFTCTTCEAAVTIRAADFKDLQTHCPGCGRQWVIGHGLVSKAVHKLMQSLRELAGNAQEEGQIRVSFDVSASKS
jgi:predicted RNA-binding Zn-ribbon protein involved in translation (DUF1610 family)